MPEPRRPRCRYASDAEVKRAFKLAREEGLNPTGFTLQPDGGVTVLDSSAAAAPGLAEGETSADAALAAWKKTHGTPGRQ
jgi:hypothetical protein